MPTIAELLEQKTALDAAIAQHKALVVGQVLDVMRTNGITLQDLGAAPEGAAYRSKRPVKFRDPQGQSWTGVGQRPKWLRAALAAGANLSDFQVK